MIEITDGLKISGSAIAINLTLALVKISTGVIGNSYALIADGIESTTDIFSSLIVMGGLRISRIHHRYLLVADRDGRAANFNPATG